MSYFYDENVDDLMISVKGNGEKVRKNYMFGDFVISTTGNGKIVGLEIRNASNLLKEAGMELTILKKMKDVSISIISKRGAVGVYVVFQIPKNFKNLINRK